MSEAVDIATSNPVEKGSVLDKLNELTATEAAAKIAKGDVTAEQLMQACLDRINLREPDVRAWAYLDPYNPHTSMFKSDSLEPAGSAFKENGGVHRQWQAQ